LDCDSGEEPYSDVTGDEQQRFHLKVLHFALLRLCHDGTAALLNAGELAQALVIEPSGRRLVIRDNGIAVETYGAHFYVLRSGCYRLLAAGPPDRAIGSSFRAEIGHNPLTVTLGDAHKLHTVA